jgi:hypothetical protein
VGEEGHVLVGDGALGLEQQLPELQGVADGDRPVDEGVDLPEGLEVDRDVLAVVGVDVGERLAVEGEHLLDGRNVGGDKLHRLAVDGPHAVGTHQPHERLQLGQVGILLRTEGQHRPHVRTRNERFPIIR